MTTRPISKEEVKKVMVEYLSIDANQIQDDTSFTKELGLDSLDTMDLLMALNEAFNIRVSPEQIQPVDTLDELVALIQSPDATSE